MTSAARYGGFVVPPALWAMSTELGLVLPRADCASHGMSALLTALAAILLSLVAAFLSYRMAGTTEARMARFLGYLAAATGLAFVFAICLQGAAAWLLSPCLR